MTFIEHPWTFFSDSPELMKYHSLPLKNKVSKNYYKTPSVKSWVVPMLSVWRRVKFFTSLDGFLHFKFVFVELPVTHCLLSSPNNEIIYVALLNVLEQVY